ncbi:galactose oxidase [Alteromonas sp. SM 2104]|nr:galactose oxidase [Alteromonas oceanisediminis]
MTLPPLPEPVTNNAVARVTVDGQVYLLSFMGLGPDKDWRAVHNKTFALKVGETEWQQKSPVPSSLALSGRLASVAVGIDEHAYVFGGYTVAEDHVEISSPDNVRYSVRSDLYTTLAPTPVPVDDAVALVYRNRFVYLISGWHNDGNVNLVQIYDIDKDAWQQASPFPGAPVFGHAGGLVGNRLVVCDGVKVIYHPKKRRSFASEPACYQGVIDHTDHTKINWTTLQHPTQKARYRMASTGVNSANVVAFMGGSTTPYNYNGIGYNGQPAAPTNTLWVWDIANQHWRVKSTQQASMDHRGLVPLGDHLLILGGMFEQQRVVDSVTVLSTKEFQ